MKTIIFEICVPKGTINIYSDGSTEGIEKVTGVKTHKHIIITNNLVRLGKLNLTRYDIVSDSVVNVTQADIHAYEAVVVAYGRHRDIINQILNSGSEAIGIQTELSNTIRKIHEKTITEVT